MDRKKFIAQLSAGFAGIASSKNILSNKSEKNPAKAERKKQLKDRKPNIIYVLADDLGYGDLGCYGQKKIHTPNLDNMATEGIKFTQHYAGSSVCAPSRACLLTGKNTGHTYVRGNMPFLPFGNAPLATYASTIGELLQKAGYRTGIIGKWGFGTPGSSSVPREKGFDYFYGFLGQRLPHNYYPEFLFKNEGMVPLKNVVPDMGPSGTGYATKRVQYSADLVNEEALSFIQRNKKDPFFLYYAMTLPHANDEAPKGKGMEVPSYGQYKNKNWPVAEKGYAAMVTRIDSYVGELNQLLKDLNIYDNTLVIFSSDNGPMAEGGNNPHFFDSNGPFRGIKRDLYEGGIRVPMIARWPGKIKKDSKTDHISAFWDMMPTFAEITGIKPPANINGISMLPTLLGNDEKQKDHPWLYWEFVPAPYAKSLNSIQAVRKKQWKALRFLKDGHIELYNLNKDIGEQHNVASQHPKIVKEMIIITNKEHSPSKLFPLLYDEKKQ